MAASLQLQLTLVINLAFGCHYFPPGYLLSHRASLRQLPNYAAWWQRYWQVWITCQMLPCSDALRGVVVVVIMKEDSKQPVLFISSQSITKQERTQTFAEANSIGIRSFFPIRIRSRITSNIIRKLSRPKIRPWWNFHEDVTNFSRDMRQIMEKCTTSQCWKILQKFPDPIRGGWLSKFNHFFVLRCSLIISGKVFMKMRSVVFAWSC